FLDARVEHLLPHQVERKRTGDAKAKQGDPNHNAELWGDLQIVQLHCVFSDNSKKTWGQVGKSRERCRARYVEIAYRRVQKSQSKCGRLCHPGSLRLPPRFSHPPRSIFDCSWRRTWLPRCPRPSFTLRAKTPATTLLWCTDKRAPLACHARSPPSPISSSRAL